MKSITSSRRLLIYNFILRQPSRHLSTSSPATSQNHSNSYHHQSRRHHEEESRNVKVFVWWDFENCAPPVGSNVCKVSQAITSGIRNNGIKGPVHITAFGDVLQLSRSSQEALSATGVVLTHVPQGGKNSADRSLLMDLMYWVSQNPPPAHIFLISGDRDFASILHRLRMNNYNILLASREDTAPGVLCSAASIMWDWNSLVKGENLGGRCFNQPPDGPYGSWYGHYRAPIEDPFAVLEQPGCVQSDELSKSNSEAIPRSVPKADELSKSNSEAIPRSVPKAVVNAIRHVLKESPHGIPISDLRRELEKCNLTIEKDFYGYKKFSRFLLSMPHILTIESEGNNCYSVHGVVQEVSEIGESSVPICPSPVTTKSENLKSMVASRRNGGDMSCKGSRNEISLSPSPSKSNAKNPPTELQEPLKELLKEATDHQSQVQSSSPLVEILEKDSNAEVIASQLHPAGENLHTAEEGFLKRIWSRWLGGKEDSEMPRDNTEKIKNEVQRVESIGKFPDPISLSASSSSCEKATLNSFSSSSNERIVDEDINSSSVVNDDKPSNRPGIFGRIMTWCKFWKSNQDAGNLNDVGGSVCKRSADLEMQELFSESFWNEMLTFLKTPKGSQSILQSKTREDMVQNLQKQGPSLLSSLTEPHLFHLVDLLISDKHWVEESNTRAYPFRLVLPARKSSQKSSPSTQDLSKESKLEPEKDGEKKCQNHSHRGVPSLENKPLDKSRAQVLRDCQKLVHKILKEYPDGYNMGSFKTLFLDRYGYHLDVQKLGYQKLATLLQIMPGVKIESTTSFPSQRVLKGTIPEATGTSRKDLKSGVEFSKKDYDDSDSPWEELGPVAASSGQRRSGETGWLSQVVKECSDPQIVHNYESVSHDHVSSDSEEEMLPLKEVSQGQGKPGKNEEDSSLLEILDSWYSSKEHNRKVATSGSERIADGTSGSKPSAPSGVSLDSEGAMEANFARKQRAPKTYSFVAEERGDNKNKLVNGIISSLKTANGLSESRI